MLEVVLKVVMEVEVIVKVMVEVEDELEVMTEAKVVVKVLPLVRPLGDAFLGISEKPLPPSRTEALSSFLSAAVVSIGSSGLRGFSSWST